MQRRRNMKKFKLDKKKKFVAILVATSTILTSISIMNIRRKNEEFNNNSTKIIGYEDINPLTNNITQKVTNKNFVLLDIGSHNTDGTYFLKQKLDYCKENNINIGLILRSNAKNLSDIYLDIEWIKSIVKEYQINYPIYLDINKMLSNPNLSYDEVKNLIYAFYTKAISNHLYLNIYNNIDTSLYKEYEDPELSISQYDFHYQSWDEPSKEMYIDINPQIYTQNKHGNPLIFYNSKNDYQYIEGNYNNPYLFQPNDYYQQETGLTEDDLKKIAIKTPLSVNELKAYNHLKTKKLKETTYLSIPTQEYQEEFHLNEEKKVGIDVSLWQEEIDWDKVDIDYAIIQLKDFENIDPQFINNVNGCIKNNIKMGFYIYSRAKTKEELMHEINCIKENLANIPVSYPVYLDLETEFWQNELTIENDEIFIRDFINTYEIEIKKLGYTPGIYCNKDLYSKLYSTKNNCLENLAIWLAGGDYYDEEVFISNLPNVSNERKVGMQQISSKGKIEGINTDVDINYSYIDYDKEIKEIPHQFIRLNHEIEWGSKILTSGGIIFIAAKVKRKIKKRKSTKSKRRKLATRR